MAVLSMDRKTEEIKKLQEWLDHRTKIEDAAMKLIAKCQFEESMLLLAELDRLPVPELAKDLAMKRG